MGLASEVLVLEEFLSLDVVAALALVVDDEVLKHSLAMCQLC